MRNLKKALAMVLALMMALSLMSFASASDYADGGKIEKNEAVEVMSAINVFQGTDGGNFDPEGELTRAQAAKIISYMKIGPDGAEALPKDEAPFDDVKADRWYTGYVAYAKAEEIIVGDGDGKFRPNDKVTGYQFGKMVLEAAGIKGEYSGTAAWTINININLRSNDLLAGIEDISLSKNITREQACQMAFNGLNYAPAAATTGYFYINVTKNDETAKKALPSTVQYATYAEAAAMVGLYNAGKTGSAVLTLGADYTIVAATDNSGSLAETVFGLTQKPGNNTTEFGAPARVWQINGKDAVEVATEPTLSYDTAVSGKTIWNDLGKVSTITTSTVKVDGNSASPLSLNSTESTAVGGAGAKVDVYRNGNNVDIVVVNTYVATIASHTDAKGDNKEKITLAIGENTNKPTGTLAPDFETTAFTADDKDAVVLYTAVTNGTNASIKSVTVPAEVKGAVTSFNAGKGTFVVNGTTYSFSDKATTVSANRVSAADVGGDEITLYLDNSGNVIYTRTGNAAPDAVYAIAKGVQATSGWGGVYTVRIRLLLTDGSIVEKDLVKFTNKEGTGDTSFSQEDLTALNNLVVVKYVETDKGVEITEIAKGTGSDGTQLDDVTSIARNTPKLGGTNASNVTANAKTLFLLGNKDGNAWTAYTGITNVPSTRLIEGDDTTKFHVVKDVNNVATLVYVEKSVPDTTSTAVSDVVYVVKTPGDGQSVTDSEGTYFEVDAIVNGEITTVKTTAYNTLTAGSLYSSVTRNEKGFITGGTAMTTEQGALHTDAQTTMTAPASSVIKIGANSYVYNDDTVVYIIDGDGARTVTMTAVADEIANMEVSVRGVLKEGVLSSLFVKVAPHTHTWASVAAQAPTCYSTGTAAHYTCDCGAVATKDGEVYTVVDAASLVIDKTAHNYTWAEDGGKHVGTCNNEGCTETADGHSINHTPTWGNWDSSTGTRPCTGATGCTVTDTCDHSGGTSGQACPTCGKTVD